MPYSPYPEQMSGRPLVFSFALYSALLPQRVAGGLAGCRT